VAGLSSCANLTYIHRFCGTSAETLKKYDEISFSATHYCREIICLDPQSYMLGHIISVANCDCKDFIAADKAIKIINNVLVDYLERLKTLSDKKGVAVSYANLGGSVKSLSANLKLGLKDDEVQTTQSLSTKASTILLAGWRSKKLRKTIYNSNAAFAVVMEVQGRNISFLRAILSEEMSEIRTAYAAMADKTSETSLKFLIDVEQLRREAELKKQDQLLSTYIHVLEKIKDGYQTLHKMRVILEDPEVAKFILECTDQINELIQEFNELKIKI